MSRLPVQIAHQLELAPQAESWLIEKLWSEQAVGIIGGERKCCKAFLADLRQLDLPADDN